jgi:class 3 adenylate cyclase/tetratricopeptide (TPR) repeat protein
MPVPNRATRAKATCAHCGTPVRAKDRFCASCGSPIAAAQASASPGTATPSASLQIDDGAAEALAEQRKVVTVLFADLSGSTPLAERLDPEELRAILGSYFGVLARQIQRFEGTIDKYIGDAVMAVFGAPLSHEDDAERAVRSALAMQASMVRLNDELDRKHGVRLALRIGINTGEVVAGMLAADVQRAYTVVGDAVNTAQRLESVAPLGQVVVSETTRRLAIHRFEFEKREPVQLKGKSGLVTTYLVVRELDTTIEPDATPFIGRDEELAWLRAAVESAVAGRGRVLALVGEPGVGKSRLVAEFRRLLPLGIGRMIARCASYERSTPYALVADLIRGAFGIHAADDESAVRSSLAAGRHTPDDLTTAVLLEVLGHRQQSDLDPERKRALLVAFLRALLHDAAMRGAFVLAAEDLQWIDDASMRVLLDITPDLARMRAVFVTTSRPGWTPPWPAERRIVEALGDDHAHEMIQAMLQLPFEPAFSESVLSRTGGNPFFIEEVIRELQSSGGLEERDGQIVWSRASTERLPATVQEVLEARLDRLPEAARYVVRPAAVIGRTFWYRILAELVPSEVIAVGFETLELEAFVAPRATTPELTYAFRQALVRDVVYHTQLLATRRHTHTRVARAIESLYPARLDEFVDLLAYHYERGDEPEKALPWLVRAADRAKSLFANEEALALYTAALARASDGDGPLDAATLLERKGQVQTLIGQYDGALASFAAARERGARPALGLARLERLSGMALAKKGAYDEARASYERGLAIFAGRDDAEAARIGLQLGQLFWRRGDYAAAGAALRDAIAVGEGLGADDVRAEGMKQMGNVAYLEGELREATELYRRSRELYERIGDTAGIADVRSNLAGLYGREGRWDEALAEHEASLVLRRRMGNPWGVGTCQNNIGEIRRARGDARGAIEAFEQAVGTWSAIGYASGVAIALIGLGAARIEAGDVAQGRMDLLDAERRFAAVGSTTYVPDMYRYLATADLAEGRLDDAAAHAEWSIASARAAQMRAQEAATERVLGQIALARGDREAARAHLELSRRVLSEVGDAAELARTEAVLSAV